MAELKESGGTALMRQYQEVKARHPDAILFFRLGDFYEMFHEDAVLVARVLSLTLTTRDKGKEDPIPMCGVPHHAARGYLQKLTDLGYRVAICEQLEDPRTVKGIVKRGVVRVVTPGVILDEESLDPRAPNYLAALTGGGREGYGLAFLDVTTGDFRATEAPSLEALLDEIARVDPREVLLGRDNRELAAVIRRAYPRLVQSAAPPPTKPDEALDGVAVEGGELQRRPRAAQAAAGALAYVQATQLAAPLPVLRLHLFERDEFLIIDEQARCHLELTESMLERRRAGSLLDTLDVTRTAMGARLLRRWLLFPLRNLPPIRRRHDGVERLVARPSAREAARKILGELGDIERLASRARLGVATPRDLVSLGRTLGRLPALGQALAGASEDLPVTPPGDDLLSLGDDLCADVESRVVATLADDAPAATKDGGFVRAGFSAELDQLRGLAAGGRDRILAVEARERERTGITSLKVKYNNVFGYYIEITRAQLAQLGDVPSDYIRKQTVANAERFVTPELSEHESQIASADERRVVLELAMFEKLRSEVGAAAGRLQVLAARIATVDTLAALAEVAHHHGYVRPTVDESFVIDLRASRHPVVERLAAGDAATGGKSGDHAGFVPNDVQLDADREQLLLVTGPNMAGKSTLIRQTALAVVLAQMGGFVPAQAARIGLCDRVFTRVGAGDNLARGESTFLVEMRETAHILRNATRRSLVILDEIGRGTSTYDGVSIAWAVAEHLHDVLGARTLFATHYHELTALAETHPRVSNVSVAAREWQGEVVFLRKLTPGGASRSFGVEVARLAGLPAEVVARARSILATLEGNGAGAEAHGDGPRPVSPGVGISPQLALFQRGQQQRNPDRVPHLPRSGSGGQSPPAPTRSAPAGPPAPPADPRVEEILATLRRIDLDDLSPRAAWDLLSELRRKLTESP